jgi:chromosome segregation ATPase
MFLSMQNKALVKEIKKYKYQLAESRRELQLMRDKSREMESLVSVIQRAWSQLDVDSSLLLDSLGDTDIVENMNDERLGMMKLFLSAGTNHQILDPTSLSNHTLSPSKFNEWSTISDIEIERQRALESNAIVSKKEDDRMTDDNDTAAGQDLASKLDDHLLSHSVFTLNLLQRLCVLINEFGSDSLLRSADTLQSITQWKDWNAEKLFLETKIEKLSAEVITLQASYRIIEIEKNRAQRMIENLKDQIEVLKAQPTSTNTSNEASATASVAVDLGDKVSSISSDMEREYKEKISMLESQLQESETAKAKVEMTLTERLARPLVQADAQLTDMRKAMEELRHQFKQRVTVLLAENDSLQEKVYDLELALQSLESSSSSKYQEVMNLTRAEIDRIRQDRDKIQSSLSAAQAELSLMNQMKRQLDDQHLIVEANESEIKRLQDRLKTYTDRLTTCEQNLSQSREREIKLELLIQQSTADAETGQIMEGTERHVQETAAARTKEMQQELDELKISMEDLILEIDSVSDLLVCLYRGPQ